MSAEDEVKRLMQKVSDLEFELSAARDYVLDVELDYKGESKKCECACDTIKDLIERCSICIMEKKMFGPSWVCSDCSKIASEFEIYLG